MYPIILRYSKLESLPLQTHKIPLEHPYEESVLTL